MRNTARAGLAALTLTLGVGFGLAGCSGASKASSNADASAPGTYRVLLDTTKGPVTIQVDRSLAPKGAQRFYELVKAGYYDGARFYRVVPGFVVQWGYAADPAVSQKWNVRIPDDPVKASNTRAMVSFASAGPNSRTTHLFINLGSNARLDAFGFAPFGRVTSGMSVVDRIYSGYDEKPDQGQIAAQGNAYLEKEYPRLDYIKSARIAGGSP
jgi:peptidyl-prolyl cis-trans isomerase A (cyclophilin A)